MAATRSASLFVRIDPQDPESLQIQVYSGIRRAILTGVVTPGARLPSSRALAIDLGVSRTTTLLAYDQLAAEGYVTARQASGTFVARELPEDLPATSVVPRRESARLPAIAQRARAVAALPPPAVRIPGAPRPFRLGTPALDRFPVALWTQLTHRRLRSVTRAQLDYGDPAGFLPLREAIADHVGRARGTTCTAEQIVIVPGAQRGLELVSRMLLDSGDTAWLEEPGYPGARAALVSAGARIRPVPVDAQGLNVDVGVRRASDARLVCVTPSHQFPLGVPMSLPRRLALLRWASQARAWILEDDYDSEFRYGSRPIPCLHGLDGDGRVIYVGTFSKSMFPALRLGFLIVPGDLRDTLVATRAATDIHPPGLDQAVLADFIGNGHFDRHLRRMRGIYHERLEGLYDAATRWGAGALRIRPIAAGLHVVAEIDDTDDTLVFDEAARRGVEVMPVSAYALNRRSPRQNGLVLGFAAVHSEASAAGIQQLVAAIEAARRRPR